MEVISSSIWGKTFVLLWDLLRNQRLVPFNFENAYVEFIFVTKYKYFSKRGEGRFNFYKVGKILFFIYISGPSGLK